MSDPAAVGRDGELARIGEFLAQLPVSGGALSIEGEPGIGKTTIWSETLRRAREAGLLTLSCRPSSAEAKLSFSGLSDMLSGVGPEELDRLPDLQRHALEVALLRAAPGGALDPRLVGTALLALLRTLALRTGVVLAVDDAQWLDVPTSSVLAFAVRRLDRDPVGLVCAFRPGPGRLALLDALERERVTRLALGPLELDPLRRLIDDRADHPLPRPLLTRIAEASGGNPFYALEMTRLVPDGAGATDGGHLPVPDDVRALAQSRVSALPPPTRAALLHAAVLAVPETRAVDAEALAPAEDVGLVRIDPRGRIEFAHPLFATAIYTAASAAQRRAAHRAAAAVVADPEARARHLAYGSAQPDAGVAAELDAAAELARSRGAPDAAAELTELALLQTPLGDGERAVRLERAAALHWDAGDPDRAGRLLQTLLSEPVPDRLRAHALRLRATLESHADSFATALRTATEALAAAGGEPSVAAAIELDIAFYLVGVGDVGEALRHAEAAIGRAELPGGDPGVLGDALAVVTMVALLGGEGLSRDRLDRALALEDPLRQRALFTSPRFIAGLVEIWVGRLREAVAVLGELRAERIERGVESDSPAFSLYLTWAYLWLGETETARELAAADAAAVELLRDRWLIAMSLSARALVSAQRGEIQACRDQAAEALDLFSQLEWWTGTVWPRWALGFAELSAGHPHAAHEALAPLTALIPSTGLVDPAGLPFLPDEIEALIALGELERAEPLVELLHRLGEAHDRPWASAVAARGRGLLATARGELDEAIAALDRALAEHDRVEMPFERGRTLLALGRARRRRKKWGAAREALREALALFAQTSSPLWEEAARNELARAGEGAADPAELTPTERQVAELAASGLTNQQVAERAFLTVKGVEANLTRAYRKLGIRSRAGLARALGEKDEPLAR